MLGPIDPSDGPLMIPVLLLVGATAALGLLLGVRYVRREARKPMLVGLHLLLGIGALEVLAYSLWGAQDGAGVPAQGAAAAIALAAAMFIGLLSPILGRRSRRTMSIALAAHASVATVGIALSVIWIASG